MRPEDGLQEICDRRAGTAQLYVELAVAGGGAKDDVHDANGSPSRGYGVVVALPVT